jgi:hypothetical protein
LSASTQLELIKDFKRLEKDIIGEGIHEELHALLEKFQKKYLK